MPSGLSARISRERRGWTGTLSEAGKWQARRRHSLRGPRDSGRAHFRIGESCRSRIPGVPGVIFWNLTAEFQKRTPGTPEIYHTKKGNYKGNYGFPGCLVYFSGTEPRQAWPLDPRNRNLHQVPLCVKTQGSYNGSYGLPCVVFWDPAPSAMARPTQLGARARLLEHLGMRTLPQVHVELAHWMRTLHGLCTVHPPRR